MNKDTVDKDTVDKDTVSYTMDEAITKQQNIINTLLREYDQWASKNPHKLVTCSSVKDPNYQKGKEYRDFKQKIKLARLKLNEYNEMKQKLQNTPQKRKNNRNDLLT